MRDVCVHVPQASETLFREEIRSGWSYRYGYSRSAESRASGDTGQDYCTFAESDQSIVFVLCDGISMSYYGDFAARFVGDRLLEWLASLSRASLDASMLERELAVVLDTAAARARKELEDHSIPEHIQGMLREVLQAKKRQGSGTMFACGRVDLPSLSRPEGSIRFAWHGDLRIRLWQGAEETSDLLGDQFHTSHQWNSESGIVHGKAHIYCASLQQGDIGNGGEVLLYTDGLHVLDFHNPVTPALLSQVIKQEALDASSDDMAFFHIRWGRDLWDGL
ncbi:protein phosphatase 2C domain-containing protein [Paenibacillus alvei]|uniref:protein phosphatase 2C domain-containing protein n=1 Tax=Paenibacillus alvei TaxID=44250 RepID=UPI002281858F|nr:PP2C family serine/threonine-protein phosphatase [Paenibacillus alvei]